MWSRTVWTVAIVMMTSCASPAIAQYTATANLGQESGACAATNTHERVSDGEFKLSVLTHEEGAARCAKDVLRSIVDDKASELCRGAPNHVEEGDGFVMISADGGEDRKGYIDSTFTYAIRCGAPE